MSYVKYTCMTSCLQLVIHVYFKYDIGYMPYTCIYMYQDILVYFKYILVYMDTCIYMSTFVGQRSIFRKQYKWQMTVS